MKTIKNKYKTQTQTQTQTQKKKKLSKNKSVKAGGIITYLKNKYNKVKEKYKERRKLKIKKNIYKQYTEYINYINDAFPLKVKHKILQQNINNETFTNLLLKKLKTNKYFEDVADHPEFKKIIKNMIIITNFDDFYEKLGVSDSYYQSEIEELDAYGIIFIFDSYNYSSSDSYLVKPMQEVYNEIYKTTD
jgi:hypothetical protein